VPIRMIQLIETTEYSIQVYKKEEYPGILNTKDKIKKQNPEYSRKNKKGMLTNSAILLYHLIKTTEHLGIMKCKFFCRDMRW